MRLSPVLSRRAIDINEERPTVVNAMTWVMRGLLGVGGAILAFVAWPVAQGAWQAQKADAVVFELRTGQALDLASVQAGIAALDRAVAADPVAGRRLGRSELLAGAALTTDLPVTREQRAEWMKQAQGDLDFGLGNAPARGVGWARLAAARQALDGTSARVVAALTMSIDVAPMMQSLWSSRLQLILDNWQYFTPKERERIAAYVGMNWRMSRDRRWIALAIRSPIDELFVRYFVRDEPNAQEELTQWLTRLRKK
jgi:hypothetical protein